MDGVPFSLRRADTEQMSTRPRPAHRQLATSPFTRVVPPQPTTDGFEVGDRVTLDSKGMGKVTEVTEEFVVVDFGNGQRVCVPAGTRGFSRL